MRKPVNPQVKVKIMSDYPVMGKDFLINIEYKDFHCYNVIGKEYDTFVRIYVDNVEQKLYRIRGEGTFSHVISVARLFDGDHTIKVTESCDSGKVYAQASINFKLDRTKTTLNIKGVEPGVHNAVAPNITATGLQPVKIEAQLTKDGAVIPYELNAPIQEDGNYRLYVKATGNNGLFDQRTIVFAIDKNATE